MELLETFLDTQQLVASNPELAERTRQAVAVTRIFDPGFRSEKQPCVENTQVKVSEMLTLIPAARLAREGKKVAVLNFANPVEPYYALHRALEEKGNPHCQPGTDALIYTPGVTVFRRDCGYAPGRAKHAWQQYMEDWYQVDVITCAAPYFSSRAAVLPAHELDALMQGRIRNILEAAIEHDAESIVLGAFGCGVFNNPPDIVAEAFAKVLMEERYAHAFRDVVFAIARMGRVSKNLDAFHAVFDDFPPRRDEIFPVQDGE